MTTLAIDIETYSNVSLKDAGVYRYADDPSFEILLFAYAFGDSEVRIIDLAQGESIPKAITRAIHDKNVIKTAFNAQFERVCLSKHLGVTLDPEGWHCTMAHALTLGFSGSLDNVGKAVNLPQNSQKLWTGKNLIRMFSVPRKRTKTNANQLDLFTNKVAADMYRYFPQDRPEEWEQFKEYCMQDVVAERELRKRLAAYPVSDREWSLYYLDQRINDYGVKLDSEFVTRVLEMDQVYSHRIHEEFTELTGVDNPKSLVQFKEWLSSRLGYKVKTVNKTSIPKLFGDAQAQDRPEVTKALELRQGLSKTSISKYDKMDEVINQDGRARGLHQFYGAATGRWSGRHIQPQNLPRNYIQDLDLVRTVVKDGDLETLEMIYGRVPDILSQLIRTAFIPSEGHRFIVSDFSAIEARVIAWYAKEQWRLDVFNDHGRIYEASAAQMFGVPVETITRDSPLRQKGKIAELALGYQGSVGALMQMGALDMGLQEDELPDLVEQWRKANPKIKQFWSDVGELAKEAISNRASRLSPQGIKIMCEPGFLFIELASGRRLAYPNPRVEPHHKFQGTKITFDGLMKNKKWGRVDTYGGKLVENIVQATARDCLAEAMLELDKAGYKIAFHIHDEVVLDAPIGEGSLEEVNSILSEELSWAPGLPLGAEGFECPYYQKD